MYNRDIMENAMGYNGAEFISDTVQHVASPNTVYSSLQVIADATLSQFSLDGGITGNTFTGVVIPSGTTIYGRFSSITLTSGQILAYKGV